MTPREELDLLLGVVSQLAQKQLETGGRMHFGAILGPGRNVKVLMPESMKRCCMGRIDRLLEARIAGGCSGDDLEGGFLLYIRFGRLPRRVVSCLGWGNHSLAPLSFRGATYSGVFTLLPLLTGEGRAHHGEILTQIGALVEAGKLKVLLNQQSFSTQEITAAHTLVESGSSGKVVVELLK